MKRKLLLLIFSLALTLPACGQKAVEGPSPIETTYVKQTPESTQVTEKIVDETINFNEFSFIAPTFLSTSNFAIISTLPFGTEDIMIENNGLCVSDGTMIYTDLELGEFLLLAKKYLYIKPELVKYNCDENSNDYAEILLQCVLMNHWEETKDLYGEIVSTEMPKIEISQKICALISEEDLAIQKAAVNKIINNLYKMNNYCCYDLEGNELGQLSAEELKEFIAEQENKVYNDFITYYNSLNKFSEDGSINKVDQSKEYKMNDSGKIINDSGINYYVTVSTNSKELGPIMESYWMFSKVLAGPEKEVYDTAQTNLKSAVIKFEPLSSDSMYSVMLIDEPRLEIANAPLETVSKIGDIIYVYNNTEDIIEIEILGGNKIILNSGETAKVNANSTDEYIIKIKELENAI